MVRGLDKFKDYFRGYENNYVLIGGTASTPPCDGVDCGYWFGGRWMKK